MTTPPRRRVSASSIKSLLQCSMSFYYERILGLPTKQWPRTIMGSLAHSIFECFRHPRHRHHYDILVGDRITVDYTRSRAVARLVRAWRVKHAISEELLADLNGMLYVGLVLIDFHWANADKWSDGTTPRAHGPEHEFTLTLPDGTIIKGFIDDMAEQEGVMIVRDFKSQKRRFDSDELTNSIQAAIYQLYVWTRFGKRARVEFILLRHPPTSRTKDKHLQIVPPASPAHLAGLTHYVQQVSAQVNAFTLDHAWASCCTDVGWCRNVCSHYAPHPYWALVKTATPDVTLKTFMPEQKPTEVAADEMLVERQHLGCLHAWRG